MPLAVTHILSTIILVDLYRDYFSDHKKYFTLHTVLIAGIAGLLPDIDFPLRIIANIFDLNTPILLQHGGITHTPFFAMFFLIPGIYLWKKQKHTKAMYFFVIVFGIMFHLFLDYTLGGGSHSGIMWLFPFTTQGFKIHILSYYNLKDVPIALDAVILLGWLWHEEMKHKIKDFI